MPAPRIPAVLALLILPLFIPGWAKGIKGAMRKISYFRRAPKGGELPPQD